MGRRTQITSIILKGTSWRVHAGNIHLVEGPSHIDLVGTQVTSIWTNEWEDPRQYIDLEEAVILLGGGRRSHKIHLNKNQQNSLLAFILIRPLPTN